MGQKFACQKAHVEVCTIRLTRHARRALSRVQAMKEPRRAALGTALQHCDILSSCLFTKQFHLLALEGRSSSPAKMLSSRSSEALLVSASFLIATGLAAYENN